MTTDAHVNKTKVKIKVNRLLSNPQTSAFIMTEAASVSLTPFAPVNFAFDDLKAKMTRFTIRFDLWTQNQRARVLKERNEFAKAITESRGNDVYFDR
jgi:hypothetical protein